MYDEENLRIIQEGRLNKSKYTDPVNILSQSTEYNIDYTLLIFITLYE